MNEHLPECPMCGDTDYRHLASCTAKRNAPTWWINKHDKGCECFHCKYDVMQPQIYYYERRSNEVQKEASSH